MRRSSIAVALATVLATLVATTAAFAGGQEGKTIFRYVGQLQAKSDSSVTITVQNGNRFALRSLLGQGQVQTFAMGEQTVFLKWAKGIPTVVGIDALAVGDYVTVNVRADRQASLEMIRGTAAATVSDRGPTLHRPGKPLYLFRGALVSTAAGTVTIAVSGGNRHALRLLVGQPAQQTFATGPETVFLHWANRIPTVIDATALKVGERIVVRVRAARGSTLAEVEATAARRVAAREPKSQERHQDAQA